MARRPIIKSLVLCFSDIRGRRASSLVSSLYEMLNLTRVPRQASGNHLPLAESVLLRRIYFLNSDRSKYVCLAFYPSRGNRAFLELGGVRQAPVVLPPSLIPTLVLHLPILCERMVNGEQYKCNEMSFRMQTDAGNSARITLDYTSLTLRLHEIEYLVLNLTALAN